MTYLTEVEYFKAVKDFQDYIQEKYERDFGIERIKTGVIMHDSPLWSKLTLWNQENAVPALQQIYHNLDEVTEDPIFWKSVNGPTDGSKAYTDLAFKNEYVYTRTPRGGYWTPLETLMDTLERADDFMYMGQVIQNGITKSITIYLYKENGNRQYINIDDDLNCYKYNSQDDTYYIIDTNLALYTVSEKV